MVLITALQKEYEVGRHIPQNHISFLNRLTVLTLKHYEHSVTSTRTICNCEYTVTSVMLQFCKIIRYNLVVLQTQRYQTLTVCQHSTCDQNADLYRYNSCHCSPEPVHSNNNVQPDNKSPPPTSPHAGNAVIQHVHAYN